MQATASTSVASLFISNDGQMEVEQSLSFNMSYSECLKTVSHVLQELGVRSTQFGDITLCTISEGDVTYSFELRIKRESVVLSKVFVTNFKRLNTFTELIAVRHRLFQQ